MTGTGGLVATAEEDAVTPDAVEIGFDLAYRDHYAEVRRFVFRLVGNAAVADELTQDAFLKAYRGWEGFRGESSVRTWLFRIARNVSLDYLASPRSRQQTYAIEDMARTGRNDPTVAALTPAGTEPEPDVAATVRRTEMTACVREFVTDLPETLRTPLVLHDLEGFTNAEIADLLECSVGAAKMRLHRARKRLRQLIEQRCDLFHDERDVLSCLPGTPETPVPAFEV